MHSWHTTDTAAPQTSQEIDPYRFPGAWYLGGRTVDTLADSAGDYLLPAPDPRERVPYTLPVGDQRRLDVQTALTTAGVAPRPGDLAAIDALCALEDSDFSTVLRWIAGG
ncbi:hypothetical protein ACFWU3_18735 [Streptomyces sp. NPDC058685]|uniref:hypothetical protein n=1 Tax=Streptomyces sp. NPDC058685 TaxID=3346598 RepID=UPI0036641DEF